LIRNLVHLHRVHEEQKDLVHRINGGEKETENDLEPVLEPEVLAVTDIEVIENQEETAFQTL
jgi:hypothetical protein